VGAAALPSCAAPLGPCSLRRSLGSHNRGGHALGSSSSCVTRSPREKGSCTVAAGEPRLAGACCCAPGGWGCGSALGQPRLAPFSCEPCLLRSGGPRGSCGARLCSPPLAQVLAAPSPSSSSSKGKAWRAGIMLSRLARFSCAGDQLRPLALCCRCLRGPPRKPLLARRFFDTTEDSRRTTSGSQPARIDEFIDVSKLSTLAVPSSSTGAAAAATGPSRLRGTRWLRCVLIGSRAHRRRRERGGVGTAADGHTTSQASP